MTNDTLSPRFTVAEYRDRSNRFVMTVRLPDGEEVQAYCPNTSRLIGLLEGEPEILLTGNDDPGRKTNYTIRAFRNNDTWVGIEAARANEVFESYLKRDGDTDFDHWTCWEREVPYESSQLDFRCEATEPTSWRRWPSDWPTGGT